MTNNSLSPVNKRILLATGGSGGHVSPSLALAKALINQGYQVGLIHDTRTAHLIEGVLDVQTYEMAIKRRKPGFVGKLMFAWQLLKGTYSAHQALRKFKPDLIIGFGGYASFPAVLLAMVRGMPLVVHEQNAVLGQVNRFAARSSLFVAVSFPGTGRIPPKDQHKELFVGNPVRKDFDDLISVPYKTPQDGEKISLFITAGSQGSAFFDQVISMGLTLLPAEIRRCLSVTQQVRAENLKAVEALYKDHDIQADLAPYFQDIPQYLAQAHLVVARSGSSTLFELLTLGRPAVVIPLKSSKDNHQYENAQAYQKMGAGLLLEQHELSGEKVAKAMVSLLLYPHLLERMHQNATRKRQVNAAEKLTAAISEVLRKKDTIGNA